MTALHPATSARRDDVAGARASAWAPRAYFLGQLQLLIGLVRNAALLVRLVTLVLVATGVAAGMTAVAWALVGLAATAAVVSLVYNPWLRIQTGVPDDAHSYYAATTTAYQTLYSEGFHFGWQTDAGSKTGTTTSRPAIRSISTSCAGDCVRTRAPALRCCTWTWAAATSSCVARPCSASPGCDRWA